MFSEEHSKILNKTFNKIERCQIKHLEGFVKVFKKIRKNCRDTFENTFKRTEKNVWKNIKTY